ncbi:hypothetical protein G7Y89_g5338 [Cudoniella acicularis]|uniref:Uncharacterized protein n=1 Tax=Cudoniella acicularis TaxID=354080 RepID=A0A8H4RP19_9HELO|nr:hypothetical protein G7Y89_g5338 [Cudoniella acicularis]
MPPPLSPKNGDAAHAPTSTSQLHPITTFSSTASVQKCSVQSNQSRINRVHFPSTDSQADPLVTRMPKPHTIKIEPSPSSPTSNIRKKYFAPRHWHVPKVYSLAKIDNMPAREVEGSGPARDRSEHLRSPSPYEESVVSVGNEFNGFEPGHHGNESRGRKRKRKVEQGKNVLEEAAGTPMEEDCECSQEVTEASNVAHNHAVNLPQRVALKKIPAEPPTKRTKTLTSTPGVFNSQSRTASPYFGHFESSYSLSSQNRPSSWKIENADADQALANLPEVMKTKDQNKALLAMEQVRNAPFKLGRNLSNRQQFWEALVASVVGEVASTKCDKCAKENGAFSECIVNLCEGRPKTKSPVPPPSLCRPSPPETPTPSMVASGVPNGRRSDTSLFSFTATPRSPPPKTHLSSIIANEVLGGQKSNTPLIDLTTAPRPPPPTTTMPSMITNGVPHGQNPNSSSYNPVTNPYKVPLADTAPWSFLRIERNGKFEMHTIEQVRMQLSSVSNQELMALQSQSHLISAALSLEFARRSADTTEERSRKPPLR